MSTRRYSARLTRHKPKNKVTSRIMQGFISGASLTPFYIKSLGYHCSSCIHCSQHEYNGSCGFFFVSKCGFDQNWLNCDGTAASSLGMLQLALVPRPSSFIIWPQYSIFGQHEVACTLAALICIGETEILRCHVGHYVKSICRGGCRPFVGAVYPAAPTQGSLQIMHLQGRFPDHPYKSICRGGCSTSRPYQRVFVGAVQSRTAPTIRFPAKKIVFSIKNRFAERSTTNVPNCVRVAERPVTSVRVAEHPATTTSNIRVFYKLQLQVQFT